MKFAREESKGTSAHEGGLIRKVLLIPLVVVVLLGGLSLLPRPASELLAPNAQAQPAPTPTLPDILPSSPTPSPSTKPSPKPSPSPSSNPGSNEEPREEAKKDKKGKTKNKSKKTKKSKKKKTNKKGRVVLHVAKGHPAASDRHAGTRKKPLETIGKAARLARGYSDSGKRVKVLIHAGVYRESIQFDSQGKKSRSGPVTFEGTKKGRVTISGSDVFSNWSLARGSNVYQHNWPYRWGEHVPESWKGLSEEEMPRVIRRREMFFVNGQPLTQVMSYQELTDRNKSFYVSEHDKKVYIHVPNGVQPKDARVEAAVRPFLFTANYQKGVTIKNIKFTHASTPADRAAVSFVMSSKIKVINSSFDWNNWRGLGFYKTNKVIVRKSRANHNGVSGMGANTSHHLRFVDTETSRNNWRGSRGWDRSNHSSAIRKHFIDFATGQKFFYLRDATFIRHESSGNLTGGLWFDYDNAGIVLKDVVLKNNLTHGVFVEASQGPFRMRNSLVCNNETGVLIQKSPNGSLAGNVFKNNILGQIFVSGGTEARHVTDHETGKHYALHANNWRFHANRVKSLKYQHHVRTYLNNENWTRFVKSLKSDQNRWLHSGDTRMFRVDNARRLSFAEWRAHTGQDKNSASSKGNVKC